MSRRPEPLERRIGKGNTQRRPLPAATPERVPGSPEAPAWLEGHGLECWRKTAALLARRGQLSLDSELSLLALCACYAEWCDLAEDLRKNGRFQRVRTGAASKAKRGAYMARARPAVAAFQDADRRLRAWLIEFGLTDASRAKVTGAPQPDESDDVLKRYGLN